MPIFLFKPHLNEMGTICSVGVIPKFNNSVAVFSNDHFPPHVHIMDSSGNKLYRLAIPGYKITIEGKFISRRVKKDTDVELSDVIPLDKKLSKREKEILLTMWNSKTRGGKRRWEIARETWNSIHKDDTY